MGAALSRAQCRCFKSNKVIHTILRQVFVPQYIGFQFFSENFMTAKKSLIFISVVSSQ